MKKLLLILTVIVFAMTVNAQIPLTRELTCTEEAFNVRFSLGSSWHLGTLHMGPDGLPKPQSNWQSPMTMLQNVPNYMPFFKKDQIPDQHPLYNFHPSAFFKPANNLNYSSTINTLTTPVAYKPEKFL